MKKFFEVILAIVPFLKQIFSKENKKSREKKKIRKEHERKKKKINNAIAGKEDISIVTDNILDGDGLDELPEKEGSNN